MTPGWPNLLDAENPQAMVHSQPHAWFPINIPQSAWQVQDADEEIFLLYSQLQSSDETPDAYISASGLGSVDSRQGELSVRIDVLQAVREDTGSLPHGSRSSHSRASQRRKAALKNRSQDSAKQESLDIHLFQDTTALRSRKGDTGSVLWRASVCLARLILSQPSTPDTPLLPATSLSSCHVLELGSGTGLLSIVLAPLVAHYTATDLPALLPLIRKNIEYNLSPFQRSKVSVEDIDWTQLHNTPAHIRHKMFPSCVMSHCSPSEQILPERPTTRRQIPLVEPVTSGKQRRIDLILAVDCIYNPSLIAPLLDTINFLTSLSSHASPQSEADNAVSARPLASPIVLIVLELRAADVTREFLHAWLELPGIWEIWSIPLLGARFAVWVGRRRDLTNVMSS